MSFISDAQSYVPVKLCKIALSIHLFKLVGKLAPDCVTLKEEFDLGCVRIRLERSQCDFA